MPNLLADMILNKSKNAMWVTILMSLFAGLISAFIDNVATVLMVAPVGLAVCKKLKMNPVGMILSIAVSSNLQGAATLVGDTTSIMLAAYADMNFMEFFWMEGRPGIFFAVEIGALATVPIMMILFRKDRNPVSSSDRTKVSDYVPTWMLLIMVLALIIASFVPDTPSAINGIICMFLAMVTMAIEVARNKGIKEAKDAIFELDFETLGLLLGLFIVIGGLTQVGVIDDFAAFIVKVGGDNLFLL
jgi:Na+/H+ antiporter NhaD/arsenite permease-like protein